MAYKNGPRIDPWIVPTFETGLYYCTAQTLSPRKVLHSVCNAHFTQSFAACLDRHLAC